MKRIGFTVVVLLVGAGGWFWWRSGQSKEVSTAEPQTTTAAVERGPIRSVVASTGRVVSNLDVEIKCKASGQITKLPFDVSDAVHQGDLLMELDPVDEQRLLQQAQVSLKISQTRLAQAKQNLQIAERQVATSRKNAQAALQSAQARLADAKAKASRLEKLYAQKLTSAETYESARTAEIQAESDDRAADIRVDEVENEALALELRRQDIALAEAQVESNQIDSTLAEQRVKDTVVLSPMDGILSTRSVQTGQIISSGISNVGGGTSALVISDLSRLYVLASVDESDIGKVAVDQKARITADAFPGKKFRGKVVRIATRGVNSQNVVTFEVKIEVTGEDKPLLKPEMTANVEIVASEKDDVLLLPSDAVTRKKGARIVNVQSGGATEERTVETGIDDGFHVEIVSGLKEGETVVLRKGEADSRWKGGGGGDAMRSRMQQNIMSGGGGGRGPR